MLGGALNVTKDLLRHWLRKDQPRRFFFCQIEAAETMIFLNEIRGYRREGLRHPPLPILNRYKPIGSTADVDFTTKRNVHSTQRSHVNAVVLDSTWEQTAAFHLEMQRDHVFSYVRNDRPFLLIPYEYEGAQHHFEPDYVVRLRNGQTLILEMKGEEDGQDRQKYQAARRWVAAVNHWGRLGVWDFAVCRDPQTLPRLVAVMK